MTQQLELVQIPNCSLTETQATFGDSLSFPDWIKAGQQLCKVGAASLWWIGDWVNCGDKRFQGASKQAHSIAYQEAIKVADYDYQTLKTAAFVSNAVALRLPGLTWSHHREVASLEPKEQKKWLERALSGENGERWTVSELRQAIRANQSGFTNTEPSPGLFRWAKAVDDLDRLMATEDSQQPIESWPTDRKEAWKNRLKPIREKIERLWV